MRNVWVVLSATALVAALGTPCFAQDADPHGHKAGAHGGTIISIGRDNYHAEAIFEADGTVRIHTLGKDEQEVVDVESQTLAAYVKPVGAASAVKVEIKPQPQDGDAEGKTSLFVGKLPPDLAGKAVDVVIPSFRVDGQRFRVNFTSRPPAAAEADDPAANLTKAAGAEERDLYLTPGGKYSADDVKANGNTVASAKFAAFKAQHDLKPKPGDKICPVTLTKANPKCTWIIDGQTYEFCCPPCVDEFVKLAKEKPEAIKPAAGYVKESASE